MKRYINYLLVLIFLIVQMIRQNLTISGNIKGLRKGKLYLQKYINDTTLINIDSLKIEGVEDLNLDSLCEAQFYFLTLKKMKLILLTKNSIFRGKR